MLSTFAAVLRRDLLLAWRGRGDVLVTLGALEAVLAGEGMKLPRGAAVDAARAVYAAG